MEMDSHRPCRKIRSAYLGRDEPGQRYSERQRVLYLTIVIYRYSLQSYTNDDGNLEKSNNKFYKSQSGYRTNM